MRGARWFTLVIIGCSPASGPPLDGGQVIPGPGLVTGRVQPADGGPDQRLAELFEQSTMGLIDSAVEEGRLSEADARYYQVLAHFDAEGLPAELRSAAPLPPSTAATARWVVANRASYSTSQQAVIDEMVGPPEGVPARGRARGFGLGAATLQSCFKTRTGDVVDVDALPFKGPAVEGARVSYVPLLPPGAPPSGMVDLLGRMRRALSAPVATSGDVGSGASLTAYMDAVYDFYVRIGLRSPAARPVVYVTACDGPQDAFAMAGRIHVTIEMALEDPALRKVVLPHELAHLFQDDAPITGSGRVDWPAEALAVALEHGIAPEVARWSGAPTADTRHPEWFHAMNRSLRCPEEPFHSSFRGACRLDGAGAVKASFRPGQAYQGDYSKFLFFLMTRQSAGGPEAYGRWWRGFALSGSPAAVTSDEEIARYQLALLGDSSADTSEAFGPGVRAELTRPFAGLDLPTDDSRRYTYFARAADLASGPRIVPGQGQLSRPPRTPSLVAENISPTDGAAVRVLVEAPEVTLGELIMQGAMSSLTFIHQPAAEVATRFVTGTPAPATRFAPVDISGVATRGWAPLAPVLGGVAKQYVLLVATAPQGTAVLRASYGFQSGTRCSAACQPVVKPEVLSCCPSACACVSAEEYPACLASCRSEGNVQSIAVSMCASICTASDEPFTSVFTTDEDRSVAAKVCGPGSDPASTPSGLVPLTFPGLTCRELSMECR